MLLAVPNLITYVRIILIPVIAILLSLIDSGRLMEYNKLVSQWATVVFSIAGISDLIDGYFARRLGAVSVMGKFIDPMADKLIHMTAMVMLIPTGRLPAWVVVVLLFREIFISGLRAVAAGEGQIMDAASWGKRKTAWLNFGLGGIIYYYPVFPGTRFEVNAYVVGLFCLAVGFIYSVLSAVVYTYQFFKTVKK